MYWNNLSTDVQLLVLGFAAQRTPQELAEDMVAYRKGNEEYEMWDWQYEVDQDWLDGLMLNTDKAWGKFVMGSKFASLHMFYLGYVPRQLEYARFENMDSVEQAAELAMRLDANDYAPFNHRAWLLDSDSE
jgi:hypothetical protein